MASGNRTGPKEDQGRGGGVDGAMRPKRWDVDELARLKLRGAGSAVLAFKQDEPAARKGLVNL